jgi:hypothetical protein
MGSFPASLETSCDVYGPQFSTSELDIVSAFENIFDIAVVQLIVNEMNSCAKNFEKFQLFLILLWD